MKKEPHITCLNSLDLVGKCISPIACLVVSLHVKPEFAAEHFVIILRKAYENNPLPCEKFKLRVRADLDSREEGKLLCSARCNCLCFPCYHYYFV